MLSYLKAIVGAIVAALVSLQAALDDAGVTWQEWVGVAIAFFVALGAVAVTPLIVNGRVQKINELPPPPPPPPLPKPNPGG